MLCYPELVMKRQANVSMNRALNCTQEMAQNYLDELAQELISAGIFADAEKQSPGTWTGNIDVSR